MIWVTSSNIGSGTEVVLHSTAWDILTTEVFSRRNIDRLRNYCRRFLRTETRFSPCTTGRVTSFKAPYLQKRGTRGRCGRNVLFKGGRIVKISTQIETARRRVWEEITPRPMLQADLARNLARMPLQGIRPFIRRERSPSDR